MSFGATRATDIELMRTELDTLWVRDARQRLPDMDQEGATGKVPAAVGVPEISPVVVSTVNPPGRSVAS